MQRRFARALCVTLAYLSVASSAARSETAPASGGPLPSKHIIVAANPVAANVGLQVLRAGGSAVDAAIAVQMALTLVEPQSSGIGGGALLLYFDAKARNVVAFDGRETAPGAAGGELFVDRQGGAMDMRAAGIGGRGVGVPGVLRMLETAHRAYGKLPWEQLFAASTQLAENGTEVAPQLAKAIATDASLLRQRPATRALYFDADGAPLAAGAALVNKPLAETLRAIAAGGADAMMTGPIAAEIATAVRGDASPGLLTADDMTAYRAKRRDPVCGPYRGRRICGFGPPSAGGVAILQTLALLSHFDIPALAPGKGGDWSVQAVFLLGEAERLADADTQLYLGDEDRVPVPIAGLLSPDYLLARAQLIDQSHAMSAAAAGNPSWDGAVHPSLIPGPRPPEHGTSEIAIVDDAGNAVSMTTTVQDRFGSRIMVRGFFLNDELTDFSPLARKDNAMVANRVGPGKRPRSSMAPTFVFGDDGNLEYILGSVGGPQIISFVAQALIDTLDFGRTPAEAVAAPHAGVSGGIVQLEAGTSAATLAAALRVRGETVESAPMESGTAVIHVTKDGLDGAADPRRDGVAVGD